MSNTIRNAYAEAAHARRNAGAMTHKGVKRQSGVEEPTVCTNCGCDVWDGEDLCELCEEASEPGALHKLNPIGTDPGCVHEISHNETCIGCYLCKEENDE